jgi:hypothetical protein
VYSLGAFAVDGQLGQSHFLSLARSNCDAFNENKALELL